MAFEKNNLNGFEWARPVLTPEGIGAWGKFTVDVKFASEQENSNDYLRIIAHALLAQADDSDKGRPMMDALAAELDEIKASKDY